jgi:hypothetical protein
VPITYQPPTEKTESFTVSGTGTYTLTEEQRSSRRLSVLVELVRTEAGPPFYYDFRVPEPRTFWGNIQKVSRDYVRGTIPLQFRRHVIHEFDNHLVEQLHQLRCITTVFGFDITENVLAARRQLGLAPADSQVWYENLLADVSNPTLRPVDPVTAIWYEILPLMFAQITVIWQGYAVQCNDDGLIAFQPPPRGTARDEQRPDGGGGGGNQPAVPLPPGRRSDPLSDSPAPPPTGPSGPPSPAPAQPENLEPPRRVRVSYILPIRPSDNPDNNITGFTPITSTNECVPRPDYGPNARQSILKIFGSTVAGGPSVYLGGDNTIDLGGTCYTGRIVSLTPI